MSFQLVFFKFIYSLIYLLIFHLFIYLVIFYSLRLSFIDKIIALLKLYLHRFVCMVLVLIFPFFDLCKYDRIRL